MITLKIHLDKGIIKQDIYRAFIINKDAMHITISNSKGNNNRVIVGNLVFCVKVRENYKVLLPLLLHLRRLWSCAVVGSTF